MKRAQQQNSRKRALRLKRLTRHRRLWGQLLQQQLRQLIRGPQPVPMATLHRMVRQGQRWNCRAMMQLGKIRR